MAGTIYRAGFGYHQVGQARPDGTIWSGGRMLGSVDEDGRVFKGQQQVGTISPDGRVGDIGHVDKSGLVYEGDRLIGHVEGEDPDTLEGIELTGAAALLLLGPQPPLAPL